MMIVVANPVMRQNFKIGDWMIFPEIGPAARL